MNTQDPLNLRVLPTWELLGQKHLAIVTLIIVLFFTSIFLFRKSSFLKKKKVLQTVGWLYLLKMVLITLAFIMYGDWYWYEYLPLHLCELSSILSAVFLIRPKKWIFEFVLYFGLAGAMNAIMTPVLIHGNHPVFIADYLISHLYIFVVMFIMFDHYKMYPDRYSIYRAMGVILFGILLPVSIINKLLGTNYIYTQAPPYKDHFLVFGEWPYYFFGFMAIAIIVSFAIHIPLMLLKENKTYNSNERNE